MRFIKNQIIIISQITSVFELDSTETMTKKIIFTGVTGRHHSSLIWTGKFIWFPAFIYQWRYQFIQNDTNALSHHTTSKETQLFRIRIPALRMPYIEKAPFPTINERLVTVCVIDKNITYHFDIFSYGIFSELMNPFLNGNKPFFGEIQVQICSFAEKNDKKNSSVGFLN